MKAKYFEHARLRRPSCDDTDVVDHVLDARRRPCGYSRRVAFGPRRDDAAQCHAVSGDTDLDRLGLFVGAALKRRLDFRLDVARGDARFDARLDRNQVGDARDADQVAHGCDRGPALESPADLAGQRDPTILYGNPDGVPRHRGVPLQRVAGGACDVDVRALARPGQGDVDFDHDAFHAADALRRLFGSNLLRVVLDMPGKCDDSVLDFDSDRGRFDGGLPLQFVDDVLLQLAIGFHGMSPFGIRWLRYSKGDCRRLTQINVTRGARYRGVEQRPGVQAQERSMRRREILLRRWTLLQPVR